MNILVTNLVDFWEAYDDIDGSKYSIVIEGNDAQCVIYAYDIKNKKVISALLLPLEFKCPIAIEIKWEKHIAFITIQQEMKAQYNMLTFCGTSDFGEWVNA